MAKSLEYDEMKYTATTMIVLGTIIVCQMRMPYSASGAERPNILFAISDDQSWMHAGACGDKGIHTPTFDRIAREGVLFSHAFAACPSCTPSRSAILTGRPIWQLEQAGVLFGVLHSKYKVFTLLLEDAGYQIANTGKTWGPGKLGKGWDRPLFGKRYVRLKLSAPRRGINETDYAANFTEFLQQRDRDRPFFFWYGSSEPHQDYDNGAWKQGGKKLADARLPGCLPDNAVTRGEILDYGMEIEHFDRHLAKMVMELERLGELDKTLIIVTSDHGNPLPRSKCNLYDSGVRVPLAIRWPGQIPKERRVQDFFSLSDLAPTLLDVAGAEIPSEMSGRSLKAILLSEKSGRVDDHRDFIVTAFERHTICRRNGLGYPMRSIRTHRYAYLRNYEPDRWPAGDPDFVSSHQGIFGDCDDGRSKHFLLANANRAEVRPYYLRAFGRRPAEELYDMQDDPDQVKNIADDPKHANLKRALAAKLENYLTKHNDPRMSGKSPWDHYPFTNKSIFQNPNWRTEGLPTRLE